MSELEAAAADLEARLADANDQAAKQKSAYERLGRESLTLKDALAQMKQRSAEMAVKAQARGAVQGRREGPDVRDGEKGGRRRRAGRASAAGRGDVAGAAAALLSAETRVGAGAEAGCLALVCPYVPTRAGGGPTAAHLRCLAGTPSPSIENQAGPAPVFPHPPSIHTCPPAPPACRALQKQADEAALQRREADALYQEVSGQLAAERDRISGIEVRCVCVCACAVVCGCACVCV